MSLKYLNGTSTMLLFVRQEQKDEFYTSPYLFLGSATYVSHTRNRPIAITWRLSPTPRCRWTSSTTPRQSRSEHGLTSRCTLPAGAGAQ